MPRCVGELTEVFVLRQGRASRAAAQRFIARQPGAVARSRHRHVLAQGRVGLVDGNAATTITCDKPGNYVLRADAEDASIHTPHDVSVSVYPPQ